MSCDYVVAVPSYQRAALASQKTLRTLQRCGIPRERVRVYVASAAELRAYAVAVPKELFSTLEVTCPGLGPSRNAIQLSLPEGKPILFCDDDIAGVSVAVDAKTLAPLEDLDDFVRQAFDQAARAKLGLWGVYPVDNPYFMKPRMSVGFQYVNGTMYGLFNTHDPALLVEMSDLKEDWERSIKFYLRDGATLRFDYACTSTNYYDTAGGLEEQRKKPAVTLAACMALLKRYPQLCEVNTRKKSAHPEIRLVDRRPR